MLEVAPGTLSVLQHRQDARFRAELCAHLRAEMPAQTAAMPAAALDGLVQRVVAACDGWGIASSEAIGQLCALILGFGEGMIRDPDVTAYLADGSVPADERVARLAEALEAEPS